MADFNTIKYVVLDTCCFIQYVRQLESEPHIIALLN